MPVRHRVCVELRFVHPSRYYASMRLHGSGGPVGGPYLSILVSINRIWLVNNQVSRTRIGESEELVYGPGRLLVRMNDGRTSVLWRRVYRAGRNHPPVSSRDTWKLPDADVCVPGTFACHAEKKTSSAEGEKGRQIERGEGRDRRSTFRGAEFQIRTPSINQERSVSGGYGKYALLLLHKFHQSCEPTHRRRWLSCRISLPYIFAHEIRSRETHRGTDDWRM